MLRKLDRLLGGVGARSGNDRYPTVRLVDAPFHDLHMLRVRQSRALAGGADRNKAAGSLGNLPIDQLAKGLFVEGPVLERRDKRSEGPPKTGPGGHGMSLKLVDREFRPAVAY
jgi:hypothetical protein